MVESTMDVSGWLRKQLEEAHPDLLRAMVKEMAEARRALGSPLFADLAGDARWREYGEEAEKVRLASLPAGCEAVCIDGGETVDRPAWDE